MEDSLLARIAGDFFIGFSALFGLINPLGMAFVFVEKTGGLSDTERTHLARRVALYSLILVLTATFFGSLILRFFGIEIPALRIAGGLVVAVAGYNMLKEPDRREDEAIAPVSATTAQAMAFFPLTMPLTVGPGTIAVSIALGAQSKEFVIDYIVKGVTAVLIAAAVALSIYICYRNAARVVAAVGPEGTRIVKRSTAFLLVCIGIQMILTGAADWLGPLIQTGSQAGSM